MDSLTWYKFEPTNELLLEDVFAPIEMVCALTQKQKMQYKKVKVVFNFI
jgi:hypothetical protein